jgi:FMN phosphatase YigB (HAD superfamily)
MSRAPRTPEHWFDFFDTLVSRACLEPSDAFMLLGWRLASEGLLKQVDVDRFATARKQVEAQLRQRLDAGSEVRIGAVYAALAADFDWSGEDAQRASAIELYVEVALSVPMPERLRELAERLDRNERVLILSDTYFGVSGIEAILTRHLRSSGNMPLIMTSADEQCTKAFGSLFGRALQRTELQAADVVFSGDHPRSDQSVPMSLGLQIKPAKAVPRLPCEYRAASDPREDRWRRVVAGAMRGGRIMADSADTAAFEAIVGHGAVALGAYVAWVLSSARARDINTVWFLARDGQILMKLAERLAPLLHPDARLEYVHASRLAWCLPAYRNLDQAMQQWLGRYVYGVSVDTIMQTLGLDLATAQTIHGLAHSSGSGASQIDADRLSAARARFAQISDAARESLLPYLESRGLWQAGQVMLVDVGWRASLQGALDQIIRGAPRPAPPIVGAYVGLTHRPAGLDAQSLLVFAPNEPRINATVVEFLTRADHGSVLGYRRSAAGASEPLLQPISHTQRRAVEANQALVLAYVDSLMRWLGTPGFPLDDFCAWYAGFGRERLVSLCRTPSKSVGRYLVGAWHDDGAGHVRSGPLAQSMPRLQLWRALAADSLVGARSWWIEGSIAASTLGRGDFLLHLYAHRLLLRTSRLLRLKRAA